MRHSWTPWRMYQTQTTSFFSFLRFRKHYVMGREHEIILDGTFSLDFNCNDFFEYSTSESLTVCSDNLDWMKPIVKKYGQEGLDACLSYIAGRMPILPHQTVNFNLAVAELNEIKPKVIVE